MPQDYRPAAYSRGIKIGKPTWSKVYGPKRVGSKRGTHQQPWSHSEYARMPQCSEEELQRRWDNITENTHENASLKGVDERGGKKIYHY